MSESSAGNHWARLLGESKNRMEGSFLPDRHVETKVQKISSLESLSEHCQQIPPRVHPSVAGFLEKS